MCINDLLPPGMNMRDFTHTKQELDNSGNLLHNYSKNFEVFKPHNIILLKDYDNISVAGYYDGHDYRKGDKLNLINFGGNMCVGHFTPSGSGSTIKNFDNFQENIHFKFI